MLPALATPHESQRKGRCCSGLTSLGSETRGFTKPLKSRLNWEIYKTNPICGAETVTKYSKDEEIRKITNRTQLVNRRLTTSDEASAKRLKSQGERKNYQHPQAIVGVSPS